MPTEKVEMHLLSRDGEVFNQDVLPEVMEEAINQHRSKDRNPDQVANWPCSWPLIDGGITVP